MPNSQQILEEFCSQIHHEIAPKVQAELDTHNNRRRDARYEYSAVQLVAPCEDGTLLGNGAFEEVQCFDISPQGFSFLFDAPFGCRTIAVLLERSGRSIRLLAQVIHCTPQGKNFLIGCRFLGRLSDEHVAHLTGVFSTTE